MQDTSQEELMKAIELFKGRYGIKEPLDMFRLDAIILELRTEKAKKKTKKKGRK